VGHPGRQRPSPSRSRSPESAGGPALPRLCAALRCVHGGIRWAQGRHRRRHRRRVSSPSSYTATATATGLSALAWVGGDAQQGLAYGLRTYLPARVCACMPACLAEQIFFLSSGEFQGAGDGDVWRWTDLRRRPPRRGGCLAQVAVGAGRGGGAGAGEWGVRTALSRGGCGGRWIDCQGGGSVFGLARWVRVRGELRACGVWVAWWASRVVCCRAHFERRPSWLGRRVSSLAAGVGQAWIGLVISQFVLGIIVMRCDLDLLYDLPTWLAQSQYFSTPFRSPVTSFDVSRGCHCTARTGESPAWILCHILHVFQSQKHT
jgi:hypothetical protein